MNSIKNNTIQLIGKTVILDEIQPKYFNNIIDWRNNPENNKFLNQPYQLNLDLQRKWYKKYLEDDTQGVFVLIDKQKGIPFGTMGWTDFDKSQQICVTGRLLIGNIKYRGSLYFKEAIEIFNNYLYKEYNVKIMYAHVIKENIASIKWHEKWGYKINKEFQFPKEKIANGMEQIEFFRSVDDYYRISKFRV